MKAVVIFADGLEKIQDLPENCRHMREITTSRPEGIENVVARFETWSGKGYAIFRETQPGRSYDGGSDLDYIAAPH